MNDPFGGMMQIIMFIFVPVLLLVPIVITAMTPSTVKDEASRAIARTKFTRLVLVTVLVLAVWLALQIAAAQFQGGALRQLCDMAWTFFFPLWFALGVPAIRAKNPLWGSAIDGAVAADGEVRTASLVRRDRENPIKGWHWTLALALALLIVGGIAWRGTLPFGDGEAGSYERSRWIMWLSFSAGIYVLTLAIAPFGIRRMCLESEPLDARGSPELVELYRVQRLRQTRTMFWLMAIVLPGFMSTVFLVAAWFPGYESLLGLAGGIGGCILGIGGAVFGAAATAERIRIAELRTKLNSQ